MNTLALSKTPKVGAITRLKKSGPGAERINRAYDDFCESTVHKALIIGQMLREQCEALCGGAQNNQHTDENKTFSEWLDRHCRVPRRTGYRWMEMAERAIAHGLTGLLGHAAIEAEAIEIGGEEIPFSVMLSAPAAELPPAAMEARQLLFDFVGDKTMKECMALVVTEGKEAHSITRAHNGKNAPGAGGGGDRKAFAEFTAKKLQHITTFVNSNMDPTERAKIIAAADKAPEAWPKWFLTALGKAVSRELKLDDVVRAARKEGGV